MEDRYFYLKYSPTVSVVGLLDGYGGPQVAEFCQNQIPDILKDCQLMKLKQYRAAIENLTDTLDHLLKQKQSEINEIRQKNGLPELLEGEMIKAGASLVMCIISQEQIIIANLGDCKCYVTYKHSESKAVLISGNHSVSKPEQQQRVKQNGGYFIENMINGKNHLTRSIGALDLKTAQQPLISTVPSVFSLRTEDIQTIIMGTGGLWEKPEQVLNRILLGHQKKQGTSFENLKNRGSSLLEDLVCQNIDEDQYGRQNMSIAVINFN